MKKTSLLLSMLCLATLLILSCAKKSADHKTANSNFSIGVIADCQYCDVESTGNRKYNISDKKLAQCVEHLNAQNLAFTVHLGDFIDKDWESFEVVGPIYDKLNMPKYHVLGNHDFSVSDEKKADVVTKMGMPAAYYDFTIKDWRFVVLNGNDISFHAYPKDSEAFKKAETYYAENKISAPKWNGAMGKEQMQWLESVLKAATAKDEKVMLYSHFPIYPENVHNLWNAKELISMIEKYDVVKAYVNGHNHEGNYGLKEGVHYITMKGMVDTEETSYSIIKLSDQLLEIVGFGRETSKVFQLKP